MQADLALIFAAAIWGTAFLFQKSAMEHMGPLLFVGARGVLAVAALLPFAWRELQRAATPADAGFWCIALLGGATFFIGAWLQQEGIRTASVTNAGFLTALYVVATPFLAWLAMGRTPSGTVWTAAGLSVIGTWVLGGGTTGAFSRGDALVALSAIFWAMQVVITGKAAPYARPVGFTVVQFAVVGGLGMAGAMMLEEVRLEALRLAGVDIAFVGLLSTALTFTLMTAALQHTPPSEAAVIVSTEVLFAAAAAYLILDERLTPIGWAGAGTILAAILLVQLGPLLRARRG
jgi:drug/metabolite transporter (DMT)-like permease